MLQENFRYFVAEKSNKQNFNLYCTQRLSFIFQFEIIEQKLHKHIKKILLMKS